MDAENFNIVSPEGLAWLECAAFARIPWLVHGFGTRQGGESKSAPAGQDSAISSGAGHPRVVHKRRRFLQALGAGDFPLALLHQTHSTIIYCVSQTSDGLLQYQLAGNPLPETGDSRARSGDALMTRHADVMLGVRVADCMPILIADRERRAVAAVHAGWRGALNRIVEKAVGEMCRTFHSQPENLLAAIGPSIRACCYEVGPEVVDAFCGSFP
ncbi:MAG: polyphenol oxidase family protein, partial [Acidobacteriota bacterium]